jgi:hypothetical protein
MKFIARIMPATLVLCLALVARSAGAQTATGTIEGAALTRSGE